MKTAIMRHHALHHAAPLPCMYAKAAVRASVDARRAPKSALRTGCSQSFVSLVRALCAGGAFCSMPQNLPSALVADVDVARRRDSRGCSQASDLSDGGVTYATRASRVFKAASRDAQAGRPRAALGVQCCSSWNHRGCEACRSAKWKARDAPSVMSISRSWRARERRTCSLQTCSCRTSASLGRWSSTSHSTTRLATMRRLSSKLRASESANEEGLERSP